MDWWVPKQKTSEDKKIQIINIIKAQEKSVSNHYYSADEYRRIYNNKALKCKLVQKMMLHDVIGKKTPANQ